MSTLNHFDCWSTQGVLMDETTVVEAFGLRERIDAYKYVMQVDDPATQIKIRVVEGDLTIEGHLLLDWGCGLGAAGLVVRGNLNVRGGILNRDINDGPFLLVEGTTRARAILGGGAELRFCGDVAVEEIVIGEYNDGSICFERSLSAPVVVTNDHYVAISGDFTGRFLDPFRGADRWGDVLHRNICIPVENDGSEEGFEIEDALVPRLLAGQPVLRPDLPPCDAYPRP